MFVRFLLVGVLAILLWERRALLAHTLLNAHMRLILTTSAIQVTI